MRNESVSLSLTRSGEPLRTLDALHLASALSARSSAPGLVFLTLDERLRKNAKLLGFGLLPAARRGFKT